MKDDRFLDSIGSYLKQIHGRSELVDGTFIEKQEEYREHFARELLNIMYDAKFIRLETIEANFKAIDLGDIEEGRGVQVTKQKDNIPQKIRKTIKAFEKADLQKTYTRLSFFLIRLAYTNSSTFTIKKKYSFSKTRDIITFNAILKIIQERSFDDPKKTKLRDCLEYYMKDLDRREGKYWEKLKNEKEKKGIEESKGLSLQVDASPLLQIKTNHKHFYEVLKLILFYIKSGNIESLNGALTNPVIKRHIFRNLNSPKQLEQVEDIMKAVFQNKEESRVQYQIIKYFEKIADTGTDSFIKYLVDYVDQFEIWIQRNVSFLIEKLNPENSGKQVCELVIKLLQTDDFIVQEFTIRNARKALIGKYDPKKLLKLGKVMIDKVRRKKGIDDKKKTQRDPEAFWDSKDLYNDNFREAIRFVGKLTKIEDCAIEGLSFMIKEYNRVLSKETRIHRKKSVGSIQYLSTWRLPDTFVEEEDIGYENVANRRIALELGAILIYWKTNNEKLFLTMVDMLVNTTYIVYHEILVRILDTNMLQGVHNIIKDTIIHNSDFREASEVGDLRRYTLFKNYFEEFPDEIEMFETNLSKIYRKKAKQKGPIYSLGVLATAVPVDKRGALGKAIIEHYKSYLKENGIEEQEPQPHSDSRVQYAGIREKDFDNSFMTETVSDKDLINSILEYGSDKHTSHTDIWSLYDDYRDFFQKYPNRYPAFYASAILKIHAKELTNVAGYIEVLGQCTKGYLNSLPQDERLTFYEEIIKVNDKLGGEDISSRKYIVRTLNDNKVLRDVFTNELITNHNNIYSQIVKLLQEYASNYTDHTAYSNKALPHASSNASANTVAGGGTELLCLLLYFDPVNPDITQTLMNIVDGNDRLLKAIIVRNLMYIIPDEKNYQLCKAIIEKVRSEYYPGMQYPILEYMYKLGIDKINQNLDLLEEIIEHSTGEAQDALGSFIVQILIAGVRQEGKGKSLGDILDKVISDPIKYKDLLDDSSRTFSQKMPVILDKDEKDPTLLHSIEYYTKIYNEIGVPEQGDTEIREIIGIKTSASYFWRHLSIENFDKAKKYGLFDSAINSKIIEVYHNCNTFLLKCLRANKNIEEVIDIISEEFKILGEEKGRLVSEEYYGREVREIIEYIKTNEADLPLDIVKKVDDLFDQGLLYGADSFYRLFDRFYNNQ